MKIISNLSALAIVISLGAPTGITAALAQDNAGSAAAQTEPCELGAELSEESLRAIKNENERIRMLSCMIGTPRDYHGELSQRQQDGEIRAFDVEEIWGQDVVARGLQQSAQANAAVTGELQAAVEADEGLRGFLEGEGYRSLGVIGYRIDLTTGRTDIFLAPIAGPQSVAGAIDETVEDAVGDPPGIENEEMVKSMEKAVEEGMEQESEGTSN